MACGEKEGNGDWLKVGVGVGVVVGADEEDCVGFGEDVKGRVGEGDSGMKLGLR